MEIGVVTANVRANLMNGFNNSPQKVFEILWRKARKQGADAVVQVTIGRPHMTMISISQVAAAGKMVKFVSK